MNTTGTVKMYGLWLVYIMRASADLKTVKLTLKERNHKVTIVDKHVVSEKIHGLSGEQGAQYKLQGMQILFEKLLKEDGERLVGEVQPGASFVSDCASKLKELIQGEF